MSNWTEYRKYNINTIELYSNLSLLDDEYIALFKKYKVCVATSLYSQYSKVHDSITQINGSYDLLMNNLLLLKQNNIPFRIGIIIMSQNESEKDSLRLWANTKFNLNEIKNKPFVCMYNPKTNEYKEIKYNDKDK